MCYHLNQPASRHSNIAPPWLKVMKKNDRIINIGPFACLQTHIGKAITGPDMNLGKELSVKENPGLD